MSLVDRRFIDKEGVSAQILLICFGPTSENYIGKLTEPTRQTR